jgi:hypothetical protein
MVLRSFETQTERWLATSSDVSNVATQLLSPNELDRDGNRQ